MNSWWAFAFSAGIATSILFLVNYYLPTLDKVKHKLKEDGIDIKEMTMFNPLYVTILSIVHLIVYTIFSPFLMIAMLFNSNELKKRLYKTTLNRAVAANEI